jgi:DnaJ-class molecular chaperone
VRALLHTEFAALLARADVSQAAFARISGYTPREVTPNADAAALRRAMARLALIYHPDKGGQPDLMSRVNSAYERAQRDWSR